MIVGEKLVGAGIFSQAQGNQKVILPNLGKKKLIGFVEASAGTFTFLPLFKTETTLPSHISSFLFFSVFPLHSTALSLESLPIQIFTYFVFFLLFSLFTCPRCLFNIQKKYLIQYNNK